MNDLEQKIDKLPKWAKAYIRDLERAKNEATKALQEYTDSQTESPFYFDDHVCENLEGGPSTKRVYVQTYKITASHLGVEITLLLRDDCIDISYGTDTGLCRDVGFIPSSYQHFRLMPKDKMR